MNYIFTTDRGPFKLHNSTLQSLGWPESGPAELNLEADLNKLVTDLENLRKDKTGQFFVHLQMVDAAIYPALIKRLRAARLRPVVGHSESLKEIGHD